MYQALHNVFWEREAERKYQLCIFHDLMGIIINMKRSSYYILENKIF